MNGIEQGTDEWFTYRAGRATASRMNDILATLKSGSEAASRKNYRAELVAERLTGQKAQGFSSAAMQWGVEQEQFARAGYELHAGVLVQIAGFVDHPDIAMTGASPDGLVSSDGLLEIKCPNTATHIDWLLDQIAPKEHQAQMLWQMECTGRQWCDFVSYDPRLPVDMQLMVVRFHRDEERLTQMREAVVNFLGEVDSVVARLLALREAA